MNLPLATPAPHGADTSLRLMPIRGDYMAPTITSRDFVLVAPCDRFDEDGIYVTAFHSRLRVYRVTWDGPDRVRLTSDNPFYSSHEMATEVFDEAVVGLVAGVIQVKDTRFFRGVAR